MPGSGTSPCAACKLLRRRCTKDCIFAPYFAPDEPQKFASVHKVFGASNVSKLLQDLPLHQRGDAVSSMVYEANARIRDPVYGCVGAISALQQQVAQLQAQLAVSQAEIICLRMQQSAIASSIAGSGNNIVVSSPLASHAASSNKSSSSTIARSSPAPEVSGKDSNQELLLGRTTMDVAETLWSS